MNKAYWTKFDKDYPGLIVDETIKSINKGDAIVQSSWPTVSIVVETFRDRAIVERIDYSGSSRKPSLRMMSVVGCRKLVNTDKIYEFTAVWLDKRSAIPAHHKKTQEEWDAINLENLRTRLETHRPNLSKWEELGLCKQIDNARVVWKCVRPNVIDWSDPQIIDATPDHKTWYGRLGAPYQVGKLYVIPDSMCCAGPIGAVKGYGDKKTHVMAILAKELRVTGQDGVFYAPVGTPIAIYRVDKSITLYGGDLEVEATLIKGVDVWPE